MCRQQNDKAIEEKYSTHYVVPINRDNTIRQNLANQRRHKFTYTEYKITKILYHNDKCREARWISEDSGQSYNHKEEIRKIEELRNNYQLYRDWVIRSLGLEATNSLEESYDAKVETKVRKIETFEAAQDFQNFSLFNHFVFFLIMLTWCLQ
ncbi:uncharacterized protein LOC110857008 isoform X2 [Folsomia candida]|uniref:Uncharacterized protein n=1 Tax=Folsomia candida TaxID=158441 RepID=A0A226DMB3_FOLCA|nr:uncharacterized protein LOC110857008 isoform X2 [Folsomia candida]OXA45797.1 hypothetical protein Fcan01_19600 [Folsomia candida]